MAKNSPMIRPVARGVLLCEHLIIDERSRNPSLISCFSTRVEKGLPSPPRSFVVYAELTSGQGLVRMDVMVTRLSDGTIIYGKTSPITFVDQLQVAQFVCRITDLIFSAAGGYGVELLAEGELVAQARFLVVEKS